jgi:hypothetical protein
MNNFSALPGSASDSRLSSPEAAAPNAVNPELQARRQKLRRIVGWVVGGAALLMCAGLVRAAIRSHAERVAETAAVTASPVQLVAAAPAEPIPSALPAPDSTAPQAVAAAPSAPPVAAKPAKKRMTRVNKAKRPAAKSVIARH